MNTNEQTTAAERHGNVKGSAELNLPGHFRNVLTLKWNSENTLHWERGYSSVSLGNERLWISSKLTEIMFDEWRLPAKFWLQT